MRERVSPPAAPAGRVKLSPGTQQVSAGRVKISSGDARPRYVNAFQQGAALVGVLAGGKMVRLGNASFAAYVESADLDRKLALANGLQSTVGRELRSSRAVVGLKREGKWTRIECADFEYRARVCGWLTDELKIQTYEGDVPAVLRWLLDERPRMASPRQCYLDIEADSRVPISRKEQARILCWSLRELDTARLVARACIQEDTDEEELRIMNELWFALEQFDQVVAWNGDRYDFPMVVERSAKRGCRVQPRRLLYLDHMPLFTRSNVMAAESGAEKQFAGLAYVAGELWEEGDPPALSAKLDVDSSKTWEAWSNSTPCSGDPDCLNCRACLAKYCDHDTLLGCFIEHKSHYVALLHSICDICGVFPDSRAVNPQTQVEALLFRLAHERDVRPKTRARDAEQDRGQFRGAFVMEPRGKGIQQDVHVADFASMYPSIIVSWNMSPELRREADVDWQVPEASRRLGRWYDTKERVLVCPPGCSDAGHVYFEQATEGILPAGIGRLVALRKKYRDLCAQLVADSPEYRAANNMNTAGKIAANQFFGVVGAWTSRFYDRGTAEAITQMGVMLIEATIAAAEKQGMRVIYCDTDSIYVVGCTRAELERFVDWANAELYPPILKARGCVRNMVKLEAEKGFRRIVWTAAKKYAGVLAYKGENVTEKVEVKGLEYKRGDVVKLCRDFQREAIDLVLKPDANEGECAELVERWKRRCLEEQLELSDVVQSKRLTKSLKEYSTRTKKDGTQAAPPPHVAIARVMAKRGEDVREGTKVEYFVADGASSPKKYLPGADWTGECDRHELWETAVYPATQRLLEAAFPLGAWKQHARTRPPKVRGKKAEAAGAAAPLVGRKAPAEPEGQQRALIFRAG